ncbi:2-succinyl-5-enolpyruvyl-6-hydroxy-3-cyclohexene-1-carboxylic-acid synthase [Aquibacillus halophilus]|uniref:2-succinyl-5-enolpyruvyl-6-hydroxy-3-cyclohexene-1-carboxylate synthase n=1 Tax=Aquibacillus halophilus TaxID=930132 RepID=A0A6A8DLV0_9BACI|nr:2-succinyl-5-enolpyruvyl-6-hydroxy-3-cyclohexene-1-carboxylic-acid synthase [Aquibacillus halophilus]MRH44781.1 2-succinyl-5-enolpyruvyl-6-hydroxy-3-cyclohexene-1-carboxylic-acid synthase [Aquibacillus halophilus]
MNNEALTRYVANFVDELYRSGLTDVVISPGSRSTPLAMTFAEHPNIQHWVNLDERSAAFFALGMAKQQNRAVAIVCTSGTAAANYYPAIVEAYYSRVPLLVLTADRPHELRDVGAPQAIEQIKMYGEYVKWFHEMALPDDTPSLLEYVRGKASRSINTAVGGNPGPVHLNFPFREPLLPDFSINDLWGEQNVSAYHYYSDGERRLNEGQLDFLISQIAEYQNGIIVCGPQMSDGLVKKIIELSKCWCLPIFADPLSQLRAGKHDKENVIEGYDAILKSKQIRDKLNPDFIIRFGAMPVSKPYLLFLKEKKNTLHFVIEHHEGYREPVGLPAQFIFADPILLCQDLMSSGRLSFDQNWLKTMLNMNEVTKQSLLQETSEQVFTEGHIIKYLSESVPDQSIIYVGNSMPIRDMDTFFMNTPKQLKIVANRGANGIDGLTSSALGAAAHGEKVTLIIGDLSFFHDFNGLLLAKQYRVNLTVVLINNNGGGIFSFLPQATNNTEHFEVLFGTPMDIDFEHIVTMYGGNYSNPTSWSEFQQLLAQSHQQAGLSVIEVQTNRSENAEWHRQKWIQIEKELLALFEG